MVLNRLGIKFLFIIISNFCCQMIYGYESDSEYLQYVNEIVAKTIERAKNEFGLVCDGSGGSMPRSVDSIFLSFICDKECTIDEARCLEVKITELFLSIINSHPKIRPFLKKYPFTTEGAEVMISFNSKALGEPNCSNISLVYQVRNTIFYRKRTSSSPKLALELKEPYEKALKIVRSQGS